MEPQMTLEEFNHFVKENNVKGNYKLTIDKELRGPNGRLRDNFYVNLTPTFIHVYHDKKVI
jgi:hypothetical protein